MKSFHRLTLDDRNARDARGKALEKFMDLRLRYVLEMGWLDGIASDEDEYDLSDQTSYYVRSMDTGGHTDGGDSGITRGGGAEAVSTLHSVDVGEIAAGMRLTKISSLQDSLTWGMLARTPGAYEQILAGHAAEVDAVNRAARDRDRGFWDITRLVTPVDGSVPKPLILKAIYEIFGMAIHDTVEARDADPMWLFLTTASVARLFAMSGIVYDVLFSGKVSADDDYTSYLCLAHPQKTFAAMGQSANLGHRRAFKAMMVGYDAMADRTLELTGS